MLNLTLSTSSRVYVCVAICVMCGSWYCVCVTVSIYADKKGLEEVQAAAQTLKDEKQGIDIRKNALTTIKDFAEV